MFDTIVQHTLALIAAIPFSAPTWFVLFILGFFIWLFAKASRSATSPIAWEDLIVDSTTNKASPYKLGYLVGLIVATWVVVMLVDKVSLTSDIFGVYLTYLLGGAGVNIFGKRKDAGSADVPPPADPLPAAAAPPPPAAPPPAPPVQAADTPLP